MKKKRRKICLLLIACVLMAAILLCSCGMNPQPESDVSSSLSTEQRTDSEQSSAGEPTSQSVISETDNTDGKTDDAPTTPLPPAPPVCELDFTQTDSFPYPFEDELLIDEKRGLLLSTGQALYDYDTMWQLLEENFPYLEVIKIELGIDWEKVKADYRQKMEGCDADGYISQEDFIRTIHRCLREFQMVGHLFIGTDRTRMSELFNKTRSSNGGLFGTLADLMNNPKSIQFYLHAKPQYFEEESNSVPKESTKQEYDPVRIKCLPNITPWITPGYVEGGIPYLKITSFSNCPQDAQDALAEYFAKWAGKTDLIIDVRGNGGGNTREWHKMVSLLTSDNITWNMCWGIKSGALNTALYPALFNGKLSDITCYPDDTWQDDFPYIQKEKLGSVDTLLKVTQIIQRNSVQGHFNGKIWVLIDERGYSATDAFACFCKETGFATLVGVTTGGNGKGTQPFFMTLPYSGLLVEYEPYLSFNADGTCNGITGTTPDIASENSVSALKTCLEAIKKERNE